MLPLLTVEARDAELARKLVVAQMVLLLARFFSLLWLIKSGSLRGLRSGEPAAAGPPAEVVGRQSVLGHLLAR